MTTPTLTEEEKVHKVLEGQIPCCQCGEFWEEPGMIHVWDGMHYCLFCYVTELKTDLEEIKCKSQASASAVRSSVTGTALSPMRSLMVLESMYGYKTRGRLKNVRPNPQ